MSSEQLNVIRQYDFSRGPNYTDSIYTLAENELAETADVYWEGKVRQIKGAERLIASAAAGTTSTSIAGMYYYRKEGIGESLVFENLSGRVYAITNTAPTVYTQIQAGLTVDGFLQANDQFVDWAQYKGTLIMTTGQNPVKKWTFGSASMSDLGGSPVQGRTVVVHSSDYVFLAGHHTGPASNPRTEIRYSDTATAETWPVGNALQIGRDDGEVIMVLRKMGDRTMVFKNGSIWYVSGQSPDEFVIAKTLSPVGTQSPGTVVLTHAGMFFWCEAGPAIWNGLRTIILSKRMSRILDDVNWDRTRIMRAAYLPERKQVLLSYAGVGSTVIDSMGIVDLSNLDAGEFDPPFWPIEASSATAMAHALVGGQWQVAFGHASGHVSRYDPPSGVTTFNNVAPTPRVRTRAISYGEPDHTIGVRDIITRVGARTGNLTVKYAMDGKSSFTTHPSTPYSMANSGYTIQQKKIQGNGAGSYIIGNIAQLEFTVSGATGFELIGYEIGLEALSRRETNI